MQQSLMQGMQIGSQQAMERDRQAQALEFNKLKMQQDWRLHEDQLNFQKERWNDEFWQREQESQIQMEASKTRTELNKLQLGEAMAEIEDMRILPEFGNALKDAGSWQDALKLPIPSSIKSVKGLQAATKMQLEAANAFKAVENEGHKWGARHQYETIAQSYVKRPGYEHLGAHLLSILSRSTGDIPKPDLDEINAAVTEAQQRSREDAQAEMAARLRSGGHYDKILSKEDSVLHEAMIKREAELGTLTPRRANEIREMFGLSKLKEPPSGETPKPGTQSWADWFKSLFNSSATNPGPANWGNDMPDFGQSPAIPPVTPPKEATVVPIPARIDPNTGKYTIAPLK
jgi:hypothetical protein